ncbi:MAG TPA: chemotaxis protein CheW [Candidatus Binatia bacterium]|nr:chemotaxis protein CheW [Candidatus Binatia bacterium]
MDAVKETNPPLLGNGQFLTFLVAGEEYAVNILKVKEIVQYETITSVPNTAPWIHGVINLRGNVVPVIDLAVKFGLPASKVSKLSCIVITEVSYQGDQLTLGVMTDAVNQVLEFSQNDVEAPPPFGTRIRVEYLLGMGVMGKKFCLVLDIDKVLSADELLAASDSVNAPGNISAQQQPKVSARTAESGA